MFLVAIVATVIVGIGALNLLGAAVPLLVGVLAKTNASSTIKALLNFGLSAIAGAVATAVQAGNGVNVGDFIVGIGTTWFLSIISYYGMWRPTGASETVQSATANIGIGAPDTGMIDAETPDAAPSEPTAAPAKAKRKPKTTTRTRTRKS